MTEDSTITYVYEDREVILTGRLANPTNNPKLSRLVEIIPYGADIDDKQYAKWVKLDDLLVISDLGEYLDEE